MSPPEGHLPCQCESPTSDCPRYGWMKGRKWQVCQGIRCTTEERNILLSLWLKEVLSSPSLLQKAVNFLPSLIWHVADGLARVEESVLRQRLEACRSCERLTEEGTCRVCGCPVEVKATWRSQDCPEKRWPLPLLTDEQGSMPGGCGCR